MGAVSGALAIVGRALVARRVRPGTSPGPTGVGAWVIAGLRAGYAYGSASSARPHNPQTLRAHSPIPPYAHTPILPHRASIPLSLRWWLPYHEVLLAVCGQVEKRPYL